jgi:hypothetical protein
MLKFLHIIILAICVATLFFTIWFAGKIDKNSYRVYNCDLAEFHPDYPVAVKQKCREIRNENRSMQ